MLRGMSLLSTVEALIEVWSHRLINNEIPCTSMSLRVLVLLGELRAHYLEQHGQSKLIARQIDYMLEVINISMGDIEDEEILMLARQCKEGVL